MYAQRAFRIDDEAAALAAASEHNFATLVTPSVSMVSHLPMIIDAPRRVLRGHLARANPHAALIGGARHMAIFTGPNAYISPDWYAPQSPDVPTWNYVAVHVSGVGRVFDRIEDAAALVIELSAQEEARRHDLATGKIWTVDKMPEGKLEALARAFVAFEIEIEKIEAIAKLSQNKPPEIAAGVVRALEKGDERQRATAQEMAKALESKNRDA